MTEAETRRRGLRSQAHADTPRMVTSIITPAATATRRATPSAECRLIPRPASIASTIAAKPFISARPAAEPNSPPIRSAISRKANPKAAVPEGAIYTCPMHPQIRQAGPGSCPICGMALEPEIASLDTPPNPELADMTRRFWVGLVLALPPFTLEMGGHLVGGHGWRRASSNRPSAAVTSMRLPGKARPTASSSACASPVSRIVCSAAGQVGAVVAQHRGAGADLGCMRAGACASVRR